MYCQRKAFGDDLPKFSPEKHLQGTLWHWVGSTGQSVYLTQCWDNILIYTVSQCPLQVFLTLTVTQIHPMTYGEGQGYRFQVTSLPYTKTEPRHCITQRLHIDKTVDCRVVYCVGVDSGGPAQHVLEVNFVMITRTCSINEQWGLICFRVKYTIYINALP